VTIDSISPQAGSILGGSTVFIKGKGFDYLSTNVDCVFGEFSTSSILLNDTVLSCVTPSSKQPSLVSFSIVSNGVLSGISPVYFRYMEEVIITSFYPEYGSTLGGTSVVVYGLSFVSVESSLCIFGETKVSARVLDSSTIECESPASTVEQSVRFGISLDGYESYAIDIFTYINSAYVKSINPAIGSTIGGDSVSISGSGFSFDNEYSCMFGDVATSAVYISDSKIVCTSTPHSVGKVNVTLLIDESKAIANGLLEFTYQSSVTIDSITPQAGSVLGGSTVLIKGKGFEALLTNLSIDCVFGEVSIQGFILNDSIATCTSPAYFFKKNVVLSIVYNDVKLYSCFFEFFSEVFFDESLSTPIVVTSENTLIYVHGGYFSSLMNLYCYFENIGNYTASVISQSV
jgi:hypothetical protein